MPKSTLEVLEDSNLDDWQRAMLFQNVQRTRLSNERNFLNWVRTSLALITLGFVVQQFGAVMQGNDPSGSLIHLSSAVAVWVPLLFFLLGALMVVLGAWEFFRMRKVISQGRWGGLVSIRDALIVVTLAFMLIVLILFVVGNL